MRREDGWHGGFAERGADPPALRRSDWGQVGGRSRAEEAVDVVAALAARVAPGTRLGTKDELRARCGVSVGTFNETLRLLQARGVVTVQRGPGGGLFAAEQTPMTRLAHSVLALDAAQADVAEALRIRDALEPLLWQDALWHASPADVKDLRDLLTAMESAAESADADAFVRANWRLHARVADITPSMLLRSLYVSLLDLVERHALGVGSEGAVPLAEHIRDRCELHAALIDALDRRDQEAVARLVAEHGTAGT
ncbi:MULTISPECIES: FadR/GntR family transcriptional regulator [unclassified Streptomyces]|uniref:FadR/GntR family transcriptional regulator n=1 Tax=unclassified Streptomyces TaxID=2593676 RepID=UPI00168B1A71|nr:MULTISPECIES: FCD domain-containing protein [unclassified Streptomyces]MBD3007594.1 FadR family transcriptional regulator [Streptomyces sp. 5-10]